MQSGQVIDAPAASGAKTAAFSVRVKGRDTFMSILNRLLDVPEGSSMDAVIDANYDLCDYNFMTMLKAEAQQVIVVVMMVIMMTMMAKMTISLLSCAVVC